MRRIANDLRLWTTKEMRRIGPKRRSWRRGGLEGWRLKGSRRFEIGRGNRGEWTDGWGAESGEGQAWREEVQTVERRGAVHEGII